MPTTPQLIQKARIKRVNPQKAPALKGCPQRRGVCVRVYTTTPKKTQFRTTQSCSSSPNVRIRSYCVYSRNWS